MTVVMVTMVMALASSEGGFVLRALAVMPVIMSLTAPTAAIVAAMVVHVFLSLLVVLMRITTLLMVPLMSAASLQFGCIGLLTCV